MIDVDTDDEDTYFTSSVSSSNLALLFNTTMLPNNQEKSLTFQPVKQPKPSAKSSQESSVKSIKVDSQVYAFKEVYLFQMKGQKEYLTYGKCGLAFMGHEKLGKFTLLLYKNQQNVISSTIPSKNLEITVKQNNYISYTDDKERNWSLNFNSEKDVNEFLNVVNEKCPCKIIRTTEDSKPKPKTKDSKSLTSDNFEISSDIKSDLFHNCDMTIENEFSVSESDKVDTKSEASSFYTTVPKNYDSDISDSSEIVSSKKADILNRVAKMGKKLFDQDLEDRTDSSDLDDSKHNQKISRKGKISKTSTSFVNTEVSVSNPKPKNLNHPVDVPLPPSENNSKIIVPYQENKTMISTAISADQLNMFFIENKNSQSEIKLNIMKLSNDVNEVLKIVKQKDIESRNIGTQTDTETLTEENKKLLEFISEQNDTLEELKEGNENLRKQNEELVTKATENAFRLAGLIERNAEINAEAYTLNSKLSELEKMIEFYKKELESLTSDKIVLNKSDLKDWERKIKEQMNTFFFQACEQFEEEKQYEGQAIKKHLAQAIIHNTFAVIKNIKDIFQIN